jgi:CheY-like chemotaxis protein
VLLVEDVALSRRLFATMLARDGHTVSQAADGAEALTLTGQHAFDVMLLDLGLPDIEGIEVLNRVRRDHGRLPVIVLTASVATEVDDRARAAGAALVLRKPLSREDLRAALGSFFATACEPGESAEFTDQVQQLNREAQAEILARGRAVLDADAGLTAADVHRLAGLAAQFGASDVAAAADDLEFELASGANGLAGKASLEAALTRFAAPAAR